MLSDGDNIIGFGVGSWHEDNLTGTQELFRSMHLFGRLYGKNLASSHNRDRPIYTWPDESQ
jgi:hypothetical protein